MGVPKYGLNICFIGQKGRTYQHLCWSRRLVIMSAIAHVLCICQPFYATCCFTQLSQELVGCYPFYNCLPYQSCYSVSSLTVRALSARAIPVYTCLSCAFYLCYPPLQLSTLCAINLCYSSLQLSTLCYQSLLSPFTSVYPMLSDSAIPLYYCLPCAISLCYPPFNCLPYAFSLCYPPLQLSTLCFLSLPSPMHFNCPPCPTSLCYPPLQLSSLCYQTLLSPFTTVYPVLPDFSYPPLQLSTLCYQSLLFAFTTVYPVLPVSAVPQLSTLRYQSLLSLLHLHTM
jgi:hypothetical protein